MGAFWLKENKKMFGKENIGVTVKALARALFILLVIGLLILGIYMLTKENWYGIAVIIGGVILSYIVCFLIHSLGYLIEKTENREKQEQREKVERERVQKEAEESSKDGFEKATVSKKSEIDNLSALKKEGKITDEEYDRLLTELIMNS